jgi:hypothetical protein
MEVKGQQEESQSPDKGWRDMLCGTTTTSPTLQHMPTFFEWHKNRLLMIHVEFPFFFERPGKVLAFRVKESKEVYQLVDRTQKRNIEKKF